MPETWRDHPPAGSAGRDADEALARAREGLNQWPGPVPSLPAGPQPHSLMTPAEVADAFQADPGPSCNGKSRGIWTASACPAVSAATSAPSIGGLAGGTGLPAVFARPAWQIVPTPWLAPVAGWPMC